MPGHGHRAHVAEPPQAVILARAPRKLDHLERPAQIHVEAAFLRFAIERSRAMNHRIGGAHQRAIFVIAKPESRIRQIAEENPDAAVRHLFELWHAHVQLQRVPQPLPRFDRVARAHQHVQRFAGFGEQVRRDVGTDVSGAPGQEDSHGVCDFRTALPASRRAPARGTLRFGGRASGGRPSIRG